MHFKIVNKSGYPLPKYQTVGSAGCDLHAVIDEPIILKPQQHIVIPTGIYIQLPQGLEAQVRGRSSLAAKFGILCAQGTIDSDYRGEIMAILINTSKESFTINPGERIAQLVISSYIQAQWVEVDELDPTERGAGRFGSTGSGLE